MMLFDGVICFLMCVYIPSLQPVPRDGGLQGGGPIYYSNNIIVWMHNAGLPLGLEWSHMGDETEANINAVKPQTESKMQKQAGLDWMHNAGLPLGLE